jgi:NAD(P)H-hydrate epimerase
MQATYQGLRVVTAAEMAEIDRRAIEEFGIPALKLMESAGKKVAEETLRFIPLELGLDPAGTKVLICCGRGNNGGDGLVVARYLKEKGCEASLLMIAPRPSGYGPEVDMNLRRALDAGIERVIWEVNKTDLNRRFADADLLIDAVLGTGSSGKPAGEARTLVRAMVGALRPIVAVDIPTGLDPDTGEPADPCVKAVLTLTLGLPKLGLVSDRARPYVGELKVLDIGFPKQLL